MLEGTDGSGKTTQTELLVQRLKQEGQQEGQKNEQDRTSLFMLHSEFCPASFPLRCARSAR